MLTARQIKHIAIIIIYEVNIKRFNMLFAKKEKIQRPLHET